MESMKVVFLFWAVSFTFFSAAAFLQLDIGAGAMMAFGAWACWKALGGDEES